MGENQLCYGCMEQIGTLSECPYCGYREGIPTLPDYIKPGTMLRERYLIGRLLGHNGEGATYLAFDTVISCKVLIREYMPVRLCSRVHGKATISVNYNNLAQYKALMAEYTELNKSLARMRNLSHLNPILDLFSDNNTTYTVYEYIEGVKLIDYLKENAGELTWSQVKKLFPPLFTTLSLVHNAGVVHRGLSPETIYVTEKGDLRITAFCIPTVRTVNTELDAEIFAGYAAPEQSSASARQGTWTDVYGICAVLYRILTGCMPTEAISRIDNDNLCQPSELNPNVPPRVSQVIMNGLQLRSSDRIQTITELVTRLFEETEGETSQIWAAAEPQVRQREIPPARVREPIPEPPEEAFYDDEDYAPAGRDTNTIDRIKVPVIIGVLLLAVIMIVVIIIIMLFGGSESNRISTNSDQTISSVVDNIIPVESDDSVETEEYDSTMPDLLGKYYDAKKTEMADWFTIEGEEVYDDDYDIGQICWQEVAPGEGFRSGSIIQVKVSLGPAKCELPDCEGYTLSAYLQELDKLGIAYNTPVAQVNYNVASDYVISTSIDAGTVINREEPYDLTIYYADNPVVTTAETTTAGSETTTTAAVTDAPVATTAATTTVVTQTEPPAMVGPDDDGENNPA